MPITPTRQVDILYTDNSGASSVHVFNMLARLS